LVPDRQQMKKWNDSGRFGEDGATKSHYGALKNSLLLKIK
jgi:hypothetical protein